MFKSGDDVTNDPVGSVVFIMTCFQSDISLVLWQTDFIDLETYHLNGQTSRVIHNTIQTGSINDLSFDKFLSNDVPWGKPEGAWLYLSFDLPILLWTVSQKTHLLFKSTVYNQNF